MAGQPERNKELLMWQMEWERENVRPSTMSSLAKRVHHTDWYDDSAEEHF